MIMADVLETNPCEEQQPFEDKFFVSVFMSNTHKYFMTDEVLGEKQERHSFDVKTGSKFTLIHSRFKLPRKLNLVCIQ